MLSVRRKFIRFDNICQNSLAKMAFYLNFRAAKDWFKLVTSTADPFISSLVYDCSEVEADQFCFCTKQFGENEHRSEFPSGKK